MYAGPVQSTSVVARKQRAKRPRKTADQKPKQPQTKNQSTADQKPKQPQAKTKQPQTKSRSNRRANQPQTNSRSNRRPKLNNRRPKAEATDKSRSNRRPKVIAEAPCQKKRRNRRKKSQQKENSPKANHLPSAATKEVFCMCDYTHQNPPLHSIVTCALPPQKSAAAVADQCRKKRLLSTHSSPLRLTA